MQCVFRCDASKLIGTGHVMRCLALANVLKKRGHECHFICRSHEGHLIDMIRMQGHHCYELPLVFNEVKEIGEWDKTRHAYWLGATQRHDAKLCINILKTLKCSWLIIDHYALDITWESMVDPFSKNIMVIDDLADRLHHCNLLLDQNLWKNPDARYKNKVNHDCLMLLGSKFCLLREEFEILRENSKLKQFNLSKKNILINFGGVAPIKLLENICKVLPLFTHKYNFLVITGKISAYSFKKLNNIANSKDIKIIRYSENISKVMSDYDFAIGACGSTVWERFCLGLNSVLIEIATNQHDLLLQLAERELVDTLGHYNSITVDKIEGFFESLNLNLPIYRVRRNRIMSLVDGRGSQRVVNQLEELNYV